MLVFRSKVAGRAALRRHPFSNATNFTRRHNSTNPTTKTNAVDAAVNDASIPVQNTLAPLPVWQRLGVLSKGIQAYGRSQTKRPYATQFVASLVIYLLGDLSAQNIGGDEYDPYRTLRALVISACSSIQTYKWFMFLNSHFNYSSKILSLATKVTVNQIVFTPIFNTYFFGMQSLLSGDSPPEIWERIKRTVPTSIMNSCKLWPAVTAFNFTFIDPQYRSIFAGFIAVGWQTYLSYLNRTAEIAEAAQRAINGDGGDEKGDIETVQASTENTAA